MRRVGPCRDVVLLLLPLVLPNHESRRTRTGKEGDDGRAYGHDEIPSSARRPGGFAIRRQKMS